MTISIGLVTFYTASKINFTVIINMSDMFGEASEELMQLYIQDSLVLILPLVMKYPLPSSTKYIDLNILQNYSCLIFNIKLHSIFNHKARILEIFVTSDISHSYKINKFKKKSDTNFQNYYYIVLCKIYI